MSESAMSLCKSRGRGERESQGLSLITYTPGEGEKRKPFKDHEERKVGYAAAKVAYRWVGAVVKQANRVPCVWAVVASYVI